MNGLFSKFNRINGMPLGNLLLRGESNLVFSLIQSVHICRQSRQSLGGGMIASDEQ